MDTQYKRTSGLPDGIRTALAARPPVRELPPFHPAWLVEEPERVVRSRPGRVLMFRLRTHGVGLGVAAGVMVAFILGVVFGSILLPGTAPGFSEVVRLKNGVRLRGKVVNLVGSQVVVETKDSVYVIDSGQVRSLRYGTPRLPLRENRLQFPDSEIIELKSGIVLRGRILNQTGAELLVEADGENFTVARDQVSKIRYLAVSGRTAE